MLHKLRQTKMRFLSGSSPRAVGSAAAGKIIVALDIESAKVGLQRERGEVIGGQRRDQRQAAEHSEFAGGKDIARRAETNAATEQTALVTKLSGACFAVNRASAGNPQPATRQHESKKCDDRHVYTRQDR
jgi:hypothetical protein